MGANYASGEYGWTTNVNIARREFEARLALLNTDYADLASFTVLTRKKISDYACQLKKEGTIRYLAFSTHDVSIVRKFIETDMMDRAMFSINPM